MPNVLTPVRLFRSFAILSLALTLLAQRPALARAALCRSIFKSEAAEWPPHSWSSYLKKLGEGASHAVPRGAVPRAVVAAPNEDSRLYSQDYLSHSDPSRRFVELEIKNEIQQAGSDYTYLFSDNPEGGPYLIDSKRLGHAFTVYDLPRKGEFRKFPEYREALIRYLDRIETLVQSGKTYPEYDVFFDARRLRWEEEDRAQVAEGKFIGRTQRRQAGSKITAYPVERLAGTSFVRYAYREEYERNGMMVSVVGTRLVGTHDEVFTNQVTDAQITTGLDISSGLGGGFNIKDLSRVRAAKALDEIVYRRRFCRSPRDDERDRLRNDSQENQHGEEGPLLAAMGLNRASYGKALGFNAHLHRWEQLTGGFSSSYYDDYPDAISKHPIDTTRIHESAVPLLKMEKYLGDEYRVPRPVVMESITIDAHTPRFSNGEFVGKSPIYMKTGEIFEPVKFYIARKEEQRDAAVTELFSETIRTLFPYTRSCDVSVCGQALYTMNPKSEGLRLYSKRGMGLLPEFDAREKDAVNWHVFGSKLEDYIRQFHDLSEAEKKSGEGAARHIEAIRGLTNRVLNNYQ